MSFRTIWSILKGIERADATTLLNAAIAAQPGPAPRQSAWSDSQNVTEPIARAAVHEGDTMVIGDAAWQLASHIAASTGCPHMELRIQEGDHWDFTLMQRGEVIADFSTRIGYYNDDPAAARPWKQGSLHALAAAWKCAAGDIEPYLIDWDRLTSPTWARPGDQHSTGDCHQVLDFMRALRAPDPFGHPQRIEFSSPRWATAYHPQPMWRRMVRQVSVWIKGTYPDVPRHTPEQREVWRKRKASLRIVSSDGTEIYPFRR